MKKLLLFGLVFILVSSFTYATVPSPYLHLAFENDLTDTAGHDNFTNMLGTATYTTNGISGSALIFPEAGGMMIKDDSYSKQLDTQWSASAWFYYNGSDLTGRQWWQLGTGDNYQQGMASTRGALNQFALTTGTGSAQPSLVCYLGQGIDKQWFQITATANASQKIFYVNGVKNCTGIGQIIDSNGGTFYIGGQSDGLAALILRNLTLDEFKIWDVSLTASEVLEDYNSYVPATSNTNSPQFVNPTPADNTNNNTQPVINCSHNGTDVNFNFWVDEGLIYDNITGNYTTGITYYPNFAEGKHNYTCGVQNTTNGILSVNITRTFTFDSIEPSIIRLSNNNWNIDNNSFIMSYLVNLTINYSFQDDNLYNVLINITNSTDQSVFQILNTSITGSTVNISRTVDLSNLSLGNYTIKLYGSDSHTNDEIKSYIVTPSYDKKKLEFDTAEGTNIIIESLDESNDINTFDTIKLKDRYTFNIKYNTIKTTRSFIVTSDKKLIYLPDSNYPAHFISGNNWIDFYDFTVNKKDVVVKIINDYTARVDINNFNDNELTFNSIGGLNINEIHYRFQIAAVVQVNVFNVLTNASINYTTYLNGQNKSAIAPNNIFYYNVTPTTYSLNITGANYYDLNYLVPITGNYHNLTYYMSDYNVLDNCSTYSYVLLTFYGYDEETLNNLITPIDITIFHSSTLTGSDSKNLSLELRYKNNYSICSNTNNSLYISSIMQFADGVNYAKRNYYINNLSANATSPQTINLYSINYTKASEIVMTVFDTTTSDAVTGAYIKTLRYYPAENILRVIEISRTDEQGKSLVKLVLADVFYKFQIEYPAGIIKLYTETQNIYALTKSFGLSFITDYLDTWNKIGDVTTDVSCVHSTKTCSFTWSDSNNIVRDATLEVYRDSGFTSELIYTQTVAGSSGVIGYTILEDTAGNTYSAEGYIESNTGTSNYLADIASLFYSDNELFNDPDQKLANLFPLFLLVLVIVFAVIDFGTVGVVIGSLIGLLIGSISGLLPLSMYYVISFIIMGGILIYKLSK